MLAAMGVETFRLRSVEQSYRDYVASPAMQIIRDAGVAERLPVCRDCVFVPYCGADPVHSYATQGDPMGHRPTSAHCARHMGLFRILFRHLADGDPAIMRIFLAWVMRTPPEYLAHGGDC